MLILANAQSEHPLTLLDVFVTRDEDMVFVGTIRLTPCVVECISCSYPHGGDCYLYEAELNWGFKTQAETMDGIVEALELTCQDFTGDPTSSWPVVDIDSGVPC